MKILQRISKILLIVGGVNLGIQGISTLLNMPFNLLSTLMGFVRVSAYINWAYALIGIAAVYLSTICFKQKDY
jgi:uncharacterized membrane protein YuzA (DUF378 family)